MNKFRVLWYTDSTMNWDAEEFNDVEDDFFLGSECLSVGNVGGRSESGA